MNRCDPRIAYLELHLVRNSLKCHCTNQHYFCLILTRTFLYIPSLNSSCPSPTKFLSFLRLLFIFCLSLSQLQSFYYSFLLFVDLSYLTFLLSFVLESHFFLLLSIPFLRLSVSSFYCLMLHTLLYSPCILFYFNSFFIFLQPFKLPCCRLHICSESRSIFK